MKFIDDRNMLAYNISIKKIIKFWKGCIGSLRDKLSNLYSIFAFNKYKLIYLAKNFNKLDITITINILSKIIKLEVDINILEFQIDCKLKWNTHI